MSHLLKLFRFVKPYWRRATVALALLVAVALMDLALPRLIQHLIDDGINGQDQQVVLTTAFFMLAISAVQTLFALGNNRFSIEVGESVARDIREALFLKIQAFAYGNLDRLNTGQLMVRLSSDTSVFQRIVQVTLRIGTRALLLLVGSLILMFNTNAQLAWLISPLLVIAALVIVFFVVQMGPLFRTVQQKLDWLNAVLQENIAGARVVKAFVRAEHESGRFAAANLAFTERNIRVMQFVATLTPTISIWVNIGLVGVIWAGGLQAIRGEATLGQIVAFLNYLQTTLGMLSIAVILANLVAAAMASAERVNEVLDTVPEVRDVAHPTPLPATPQHHIAFEQVGFHYNGNHTEAVLADVNLTATAGQTVAILGATGAGKTSLVNLIPRFYDVATGRVTLDGVDVRQRRQRDLLERISLVPQETVLFSGSVRDNIRYGQPTASEAEVVAAAQAAQAHAFILKLPRGYDTHVEERGVNLSGGQKQRIAIARALLLRPEILILDDSTSAVDVQTETQIQAALKDWLHHTITFVVAQRISTVLHADQIVVLDEGRVVARGTHTELMQTSPVYQEIYASQLGAGVKAEV